MKRIKTGNPSLTQASRGKHLDFKTKGKARTAPIRNQGARGAFKCMELSQSFILADHLNSSKQDR